MRDSCEINIHLINVVATPLWGVFILGVAGSGRRTRHGEQALPWLQRERIYEAISSRREPIPTEGLDLDDWKPANRD